MAKGVSTKISTRPSSSDIAGALLALRKKENVSSQTVAARTLWGYFAEGGKSGGPGTLVIRTNRQRIGKRAVNPS